MASFELYVALRYLRAKRKQAVISIITWISILGVAAGVMALIVALAINTGFRNSLQRTLFRTTAHVSILENQPGEGISNWRQILANVSKIPNVVSAGPTLYGNVFFYGPMQSEGGVLKGIDIHAETHRNDIIGNLREGSIDELEKPSDVPGIILGIRLARATGMLINSRITVISPQGELTPYGPRPAYYPFRVVGIFDSGFYEIDRAWAFTTMKNVQKILAVGDVANSIELKVSPIDNAQKVAQTVQKTLGPKLSALSWMEQNRQILSALWMERIVTTVTISLILLTGALNILISQIMMVMEKQRDIALLLAMGAKTQQIRGVFLLQGAIIGITGTCIGLILGYSICFLAGYYKWPRLEESVYSVSYVPFEPRWLDGVYIAAGAILLSLLTAWYPARNAAKVLPAVALRYE